MIVKVTEYQEQLLLEWWKIFLSFKTGKAFDFQFSGIK